jgi:formate dehydrogenase subunit delta
MAHEIARQFAGEPQEESAETIAAHLQKFWAPTMITALLAEADAGADLEPLVVRVVELLR